MVSHCQATIVKVLTALEATVCSLEDTEAEKLLMNGTALEIETPVLLRSTLTNTRSADLEVDGIIHATMQQGHSQDFSKWGGGVTLCESESTHQIVTMANISSWHFRHLL